MHLIDILNLEAQIQFSLASASAANKRRTYDAVTESRAEERKAFDSKKKGATGELHLKISRTF